MGGQARPRPSGICVDLRNMNKIISIHEADFDLICQPGAKLEHINETLKKKGIPLFFPHDIAQGMTISDIIDRGYSGSNTVRYGTPSEWLINAAVILPSGEVIKMRSRARKSAAGLDLTKLFIGAERTLGIVTEVTIRLAPILPSTVAVVQFSDIQGATKAVTESIKYGAGKSNASNLSTLATPSSPPTKTEPQKAKTSLTTPSTILCSLNSKGPTQAALRDTAEIVRRVVERYGGEGFEVARTQNHADQMWSSVMDAKMRKGVKISATDVCVPLSNLSRLIVETRKDIEKEGFRSTIRVRLGDGNVLAVIQHTTDEEKGKARRVLDRVIRRAIRLEGTCKCDSISLFREEN